MNPDQLLQLDHNPKKLLPCPGIYATLLHLDDQQLPALTKISSEKHDKDHNARTSINTYLLDFHKSQAETVSAKLDIVKFIRQVKPNESFDLDDLQMKPDLNHAREVLSHAT